MPTDRPALIGILNVTPDSFSDGAMYLSPTAAIDAALRMAEDGVDVVEVGGESTRPRSAPVPLDEELRRVGPVVEALAREGVRFSVDTMKPAVAKLACDAGAWMVNDVTALADPEMASVCVAAGCEVCVMHMQGTPQTMQVEPVYNDVVEDVCDFLLQRADYAEGQGVHPDRIWIDPGIGFGKTLEHNLAILKNLGDFTETGYKVFLGVSRKSFIGRILERDGEPAPTDARLEGTLAVQTLAQAAGVSAIRAHDVLAARRAIDVAAAILNFASE